MSVFNVVVEISICKFLTTSKSWLINLGFFKRADVYFIVKIRSARSQSVLSVYKNLRKTIVRNTKYTVSRKYVFSDCLLVAVLVHSD